MTFVSAGGSASLREKIAAAAPISGPFLVEKEQGQTANPYGHVTEQMRRDNSERMDRYIEKLAR